MKFPRSSELNKKKMKSDFQKHKELTKRLEKFHKNGHTVKLKSTLKEKPKKKDLKLKLADSGNV